MGGLFGCCSKDECVSEVFYGTDYHSHLGTRRGGMAFMDGADVHRSIHNIESDYFRSKFEPNLDKFSGNKGIGVISDNDPQPLVVNSHLGPFAIVTVGRVVNMEQLIEQAFASRNFFTESKIGGASPTELVAMLICQEDSFEAGIRNVQASVQGSCSILLLTPQGLWAARDKLGRTPLVIGKKAGAYAVASESSSFPNLGFELDYFIGPGEAVFIDPEGWEQKLPPGDKMQVCSFLWVYYGYPASSYENINVEAVRYKCGAALAKNDDVRPDYAAGIPDSGIGHALGYANEKRIPYQRPFVKYTPTWPRSFMPQNQKVRDLVAQMKLIPVAELIEGKAPLFCDDSVVRGTQLKGTIQGIFKAGAREVHMRLACPCLIFPCDFLNFSTSQSSMDLIGRRAVMAMDGGLDKVHDYAVSGRGKKQALNEWIGGEIGLNSLKYQRLEDLVEAIGLPKSRLCTHCWDGSSYF
ncbi:amidophosphoribosyltransferase [Desulfatibacillum aliphaticivorans]|uniref:amidophosphoribosyltransferase n=1 Tax=Desulfatibacillum aliphaticivorans TaxID=218208 RepID=UPI0004810144|nr:amidophosphoribosyltransferase [Desulfatibacillum aliphaticivorans]